MKSQKQKDITVESWIRGWQREYRSYIKESTFATYSVAIENHILPYFGRKKIRSISMRTTRTLSCSYPKRERKTVLELYLTNP